MDFCSYLMYRKTKQILKMTTAGPPLYLAIQCVKNQLNLARSYKVKGSKDSEEFSLPRLLTVVWQLTISTFVKCQR